MTQEMCDTAVNRSIFVLDFILNQYKTQERCGRVVSEESFLIVYCPDKHLTQSMCDEAVDDPLAALRLIPYWFVTSRMIKKLYFALCTDENVLYFNEDSGNFIFSCNEMGILNKHLSNFNVDNDSDEDDPDTFILIRILELHI